MRLAVTSVVAFGFWLFFFAAGPVYFAGSLWPVAIGLVLLFGIPLSLASRGLSLRPALAGSARQPAPRRPVPSAI